MRSSRNPSRDGSVEPEQFERPDVNGQGAGNGHATGAMLSPAELAKKYKMLKKQYLARQREKAGALLLTNTANFQQYVAHRLEQAATSAATSLPIPKMGTGVGQDVPGSVGPVQVDPLAAAAAGPSQSGGVGRGAAPAAPGAAPAPGELLLPLAERRAGVRLAPGGGLVRLHVRGLPLVQPPPSYTTWSYLKRNELARDHGRRMFLVDEQGETVPADDGETEERLPWEEADGAAVDAAMAALAGEHGWEDPDVLEGLLEALRPTPQPEALAQRLAYLHRLRAGDSGRRDMEVEEVLDCFLGAWCRRCRVYGCRTHSGGHVRPHHQPAPPPPDSLPGPCGPGCWKHVVAAGAGAAAVGAAAGGQGAARAAGAEGAAGGAASAGDAAHDPMDVDGEGAGTGARRGGEQEEEWSVFDLSMVREGIKVFGPRNPCMVAALVGPHRTCAAVAAAIERLRRGEAGAARGQAGEGEAAGPADGAGAWGGGEWGEGDPAALARVPARRKGRGMKKTLMTNRPERSLVARGRSEQRGPNDPWQEYQPCTCAGKCRADCPCVAAHNFCEKFCACSPACKERFRGCTCKGGCKNNACPCAAAGRECDPDLCGGCAPTLEGRAEAGRECHNMRLRMRQHAHVVLGTSDIPGAGWGLFAAQYVGRNGFLGEYTGDLITQDEANRRGSVYDHMNNSYLFNLNTEWVVDAKFRGNKLRCANHSSEPLAKAKVLLVDGESRIAIFADKPVNPGVEITYDYRYTDDTAPKWVKRKGRGGPAGGGGGRG